MQAKNLICEECGTVLQTENNMFWEKCSKCGKTLCFNCISTSSNLQYSCKECLVKNKGKILLEPY